ncbi:MAG: hypothetical protein K8U57_00300 [Planctomycetes bacterium]|nr:hypothetical protein [Planctomycetota bacterium]
MSRLQSGGLVLLLAIPFALYIVWQVQAGARADFASPSPPTEKGLPDSKKLTETKAKTEKWANDVRQASAVALQYRAPGPEDKSDDADCTALAKAAAVRAGNLNDLEKFLSGVDSPTYVGSLKTKYAEWQLSKVKLAEAQTAIETWLRSSLPVAVETHATATQTMKSFEELITAYQTSSKFADSSKASTWHVEARVKVLEALESTSQRPYEEVLALPLPFPKDSKLVEKAVGAPSAIREQVKLLESELVLVEADKRHIPEHVTKAANSVIRRADEWSAKEELLALFADPELFTDPNKATEWLPKVQAQFNKTQTESGRELIRKKVQQFCDAYIPKAAKLDAKVLFRDKEEPRGTLKAVYQIANQDAVERNLTDHPSTLNEFNFSDLYPDFDRIRSPNRTGGKDSLKPTLASIAAREFTVARATVTTWTPATINQLKKKCEGEVATVQQKRREQLDSLTGTESVRDPLGSAPNSAWTPQNSRIWTRLTALSNAMEKSPGLFESGK